MPIDPGAFVVAICLGSNQSRKEPFESDVVWNTQSVISSTYKKEQFCIHCVACSYVTIQAKDVPSGSRPPRRSIGIPNVLYIW